MCHLGVGVRLFSYHGEPRARYYHGNGAPAAAYDNHDYNAAGDHDDHDHALELISGECTGLPTSCSLESVRRMAIRRAKPAGTD